MVVVTPVVAVMAAAAMVMVAVIVAVALEEHLRLEDALERQPQRPGLELVEQALAVAVPDDVVPLLPAAVVVVVVVLRVRERPVHAAGVLPGPELELDRVERVGLDAHPLLDVAVEDDGAL